MCASIWRYATVIDKVVSRSSALCKGGAICRINLTHPDIKKLGLLFTVVDGNKSEFYLDLISQFEVNCRLVVGGQVRPIRSWSTCWA